MSIVKIITQSTAIFFLILTITDCRHPLSVNETRILKNTRLAYDTIEFKREPILKITEIKKLSSFLMRNFEELKTFNSHSDIRTIQITDYKKNSAYVNRANSDCFRVPTFHNSFLKEYIPPSLIDSLTYYLQNLESDLISGFTVCNKNYQKNTTQENGSISLDLTSNDKPNGSFYIYHNIIFNLESIATDTITSIYTGGLKKDTLLSNSYRYTITIIPYTGI